MRLDASKRWAGVGGSLGLWGHKRVREGGSWGGPGFPEDRTGRFYKRIFVGGGTVNFLGHLGPLGVSLWASFFLFLIYNYNIYEYINITNVCEHEADTPEVPGSEGKSCENPSLASSFSPSLVSGQRGALKSGGMSFAARCLSCLHSEFTPAIRKKTPTVPILGTATWLQERSEKGLLPSRGSPCPRPITAMP